MKPNITPTNHELYLPEDQIIVSKTDTKGRITYTNRAFMNISGYRESELLGLQHNVIRHPDMPRGVFQMLWQTLRDKNEFFGYVKNLCKDGSHYWVYANITPDYDTQGKLRGYYSVRRQPTAKAIATIVPLYAQMRALEKQSATQDAIATSLSYLESILTERNTNYLSFVQSLDTEENLP